MNSRFASRVFYPTFHKIKCAIHKVSFIRRILFHFLHEIMTQKKLLITSNKQKHVLDVHDIVYIKALNIYSIVHLKNGHSFQASETISQIEDQLLQGSFFRTHRSYLLNMLFISTYRKTDKKVTIKGSDVEIPVARDKVKAFELTLRTVFLEN